MSPVRLLIVLVAAISAIGLAVVLQKAMGLSLIHISEPTRH